MVPVMFKETIVSTIIVLEFGGGVHERKNNEIYR
ncbi:hypothetical protein HNR27_003290 [Ornithinibacillus bavariensis]